MKPDTIIAADPIVQRAWQDAMLDDPSYKYILKKGGESAMDKLFDWLQHWIAELFDGDFNGLPDLVGFIIVVGVLTLVILFIMKSRKQGLFASSGSRLALVQEEQLEAPEDLDRLIGVAVNDGNYRLAIRLLYRRTLSELKDLGMINFRPERTDAEYVRDLAGTAFGDSYRQAVRMFQSAWYGLEQVSMADFHRAQQAFDAVRATIRHHV